MTKKDRKSEFVHQLSVFLVGNQAKKSIALEMGKESAKEWANLRSTTPLFGYPTINQAEITLNKWLLDR